MRARKEERPYVLGEVSAAEAEQLRFLRTNFLRAAEETDAKAVLVSTDSDAKGTARAVLQLACALTALGKTVLVADFDRRNACVTGESGADAKGKTFNAYLSENCKADELPQATSVKGLSVICAEASEGRRLTDDLLARRLVETVRSSYDYLFLVAAPCSESADVYSFDELADAALVMVREKASTHRFLKNILEYYARRETKVAGIMMI